MDGSADLEGRMAVAGLGFGLHRAGVPSLAAEILRQDLDCELQEMVCARGGADVVAEAEARYGATTPCLADSASAGKAGDVLDRFGRCCYLHRETLTVLHDQKARRYVSHDVLWCPEGHECKVWGAFDSEACVKHGAAKHRGCIYAVASAEGIVGLSASLSALDALLDRMEATSEQFRTYGTTEQLEVEVA
jgi:hypothetical protein